MAWRIDWVCSCADDCPDEPAAAGSAGFRRTDRTGGMPVLGPLAQGHGGRRAVELKPGLGRSQAIVDVLDILYALVGQPVFQRFDAMLAIDWYAVFPCGAAADHGGEVDPGFGDEFKRLGECLVAHTGREVFEGYVRH